MKMKQSGKSILAFLITCTVILNGFFVQTALAADSNPASQEKNPTVTYYTHVQKHGNQSSVKNGETSGVIGQSLRMEAVWINISGTGYSGGISYSTHVQTYGWMPEVKDGDLSGTTGEAKRIEAIKIQLYGEVSNHYDIYYRAYVQRHGWLDWAKNGAPAGSASQGLRLEGIQVMLVEKGGNTSLSTVCSYLDLGKNTKGYDGLINYRTHVQTYGNQDFVSDGSLSGTSGEAKRLEGLYVKLGKTTYKNSGVRYKTHIQTYGWENTWRQNGEMSGTSGEAKRLEGLQLELYGDIARHYDIYYRVHIQTYGWLGWAKNGEKAGSEGLAKRLEALQIVLIPKNGYSELLKDGIYASPYLNGNDLSSLTYSQRISLITNNHGLKNVSKSLADSWQKTITVPTWNFESRNSMNKVTVYRKLTLNNAIADYTYRAFLEIYNSPDKPVIDNTLYAYSYRANVNNPSVLSQHSYGAAIDINTIVNPNGMRGRTLAEYNAMPSGTISEQQTKAKAIYEGCTILKVFEKYGFTWGGYRWRDAMHFDFIDY